MIDFAIADPAAWLPVHDGVMGGLSTGALTVTAAGTGLFAGEVSLANNGGFASVRTVLGDHELGAAGGLVLRVRGDGRPYRVRLRTDQGFDGVAYQAGFSTTAGRWLEVFCPFTDFVPVFRGRPVPAAPPLDPAAVRQLGLMIADKQAGPFALEIAWIRARPGGTEGAPGPAAGR
ncbi:MAG: CIA30 family protein [Candidatus Krumholzibacteriia bacterium]